MYRRDQQGCYVVRMGTETYLDKHGNFVIGIGNARRFRSVDTIGKTLSAAIRRKTVVVRTTLA